MRFHIYCSLLITYILLSASPLYAYTYQPEITTFNKDDYGAERQNWDIEVDDNNIVYVANNKGLLRYVHGQWILNELPSGQDIRSICVDNNIIWCGGDEMGYFEVGVNGNLTYHHISNAVGHIWNVETHKDMVFYQSNNIINIYDKQKHNFVQYRFTKGLSGLGIWNNEMWTVSGENGLGILKFDGFHKIIPFPAGQKHEVRSLFEHNEQLYIVLINGEIFKYNGEFIEQVELPEQHNCFSAIHYDDHTLYLGSILEGIIPVTTDGDQFSFQKKIKQVDGLLDNTVLSLAVDNHGNIWAGLDYGIAMINQEGLLKTIIKKGATYDILIDSKSIYVATNKGLYTNYNQDDFSLVTNSQGQIWRMKKTANGLFACHNNGLMRVNKTTSNLIYNETGVMDVAQFGSSNNYLFSAYTGILWMQKKGDTFIEKQNLQLWGNPNLSYDGVNNCIWAHFSRGDGIVRKITATKDSCIVTESNMLRVFSTQAGLFFYDGNAMYEYVNGKFEDCRTSIVQAINGNDIAALEVSLDDKIAIYIQDGELKLIEELADGSTVIHNKLLSEVNNELLKKFECVRISDEVLYIATEQGVNVFPLDLKYNQQKLTNPIISRIEVAYSDSLKPKSIYYPYTQKALKLPGSKFKTITLWFAQRKKQNLEYRYRLMPYTEEWSEWSHSHTQIAYGDLKPNKYHFELESRYNGSIVKETRLPIIIQGIGYYYLRIAIVGFVLLALSLIIIQYIRNYNLKAKHKQFMEQSAEEQVQDKKKQLLQFTEIIRHKNAFLVEVKDVLAQMKNNTAARWVNKIDQEINKEKKEFLFHKLFSEDHQAFIQKISSEYTQLTPHDIRLISFIRINSNTGEIAQFLNISASSVDTARYRLRKKLGLEHSQNLNSFIRDF